jgi:hypothetical protein
MHCKVKNSKGNHHRALHQRGRQSEREVFKQLGVSYREPMER